MTREDLEEYITDPKWLDKLMPYLEKYGDELFSKIAARKKEGKVIWPTSDKCFNAFNLCKWDDVRVVILGQDPYHTANVADGLAFSSAKPSYCPPSLANILKEVENDVYNGFNLGRTTDYSLKNWTEQGVLLLNTALTVEQGEPGSHVKIWRDFTTHVLMQLNLDKAGLVFLLWGGYAKGFKHHINSNVHSILDSGHPSPMSAMQGLWFNNKHFTQTNQILVGQNGETAAIQW